MIILQNQPQKKYIEEIEQDSILIGKGKKNIYIGDFTKSDLIHIRALNFNVANYGNDLSKPMKIGLGALSHSKTDNQVIIGGHYNYTNPQTVTLNIGGTSSPEGWRIKYTPVFKATNKNTRSVEINYIVEPGEKEIKPMLKTLQNNGIILLSKNENSTLRILNDSITIAHKGEMIFDMQNDSISIGTPTIPVNDISLSTQGIASLKSKLGIA